MPAEQRVTAPPSRGQSARPAPPPGAKQGRPPAAPPAASPPTASTPAPPADRAERKAPRPPAPPAAAPRTVRVTRAVIRDLDPWSVGKVSLCFYLAAYLVLLTALIILWGAASATGVVDNVESFMDDIGFANFRFLPGQLLRATAVGGLVLAAAGAVANVLLAVLYNLIGEVVGGVRITLADDQPRRTSK